MSVLVGYRFKGIVKKEFRDIFEPIALEGKWNESPDEFLNSFGSNWSARKIPMAHSGYAKRWRKDPWQRSYNKETGEWKFEADFNFSSFPFEWWEPHIIPYCMESVSHYEKWEEVWADAWDGDPDREYTRLLKFENGKYIKLGWFDIDGKFLTEDQFIEEIGLDNYKSHIQWYID